ncbi:MAG: TRAP transporter small permease [Lachnospiraceae bacterium]|nr:TRAP transporter small permease [Lachnospiraceae bacterium]
MEKMYRGFDHAVELIENFLCAAPMAVILVIEAVHVFCRYALKSGIVWSDEVITNLVVIVVMFGGARAIRNNEHTELTGTADSLPEPVRTVVRVITTFSTLAFLVILFYGSILFISRTGNLSTTYLRIPKVAVYMPLLVGSLFMIYEFIKTIKYRITRDVIDIYDPENYKEEEETA